MVPVLTDEILLLPAALFARAEAVELDDHVDDATMGSYSEVLVLPTGDDPETIIVPRSFVSSDICERALMTPAVTSAYKEYVIEPAA